ncbi:MAG: phosphate acetyltransferase [Candidatus Accumulibacter sp.]|jgi:phosphate acetyltransferase|nr:phosphate acetyltransferase [Accumulibacter sp.]
MAKDFRQIFFIVPARQSVGLTSVSLGVVRALQRIGADVAYVKPIAQELTDNSIHFARELFRIPSPEALTLQDAADYIASNQMSELLEKIVTLCLSGGQGGALVVEGLHTDPSYSFISQLNVEMARSLKAGVVVVGNAALPDPALISRLCISHFQNGNCKVVGTVLNQAPEGFDREAARRALKEIPLWGVVCENRQLKSPRTSDVAQRLDAELISSGDIESRRVHEMVIASRSVESIIPRLHPGVLLITSGDRNDVILAAALAESRGIRLAGLLLTHSSRITPEVMELAAPALETSGLPILLVQDDSFVTARRIAAIPAAVPHDDIDRMNAIVDTVAENLDLESISTAFNFQETTKLSPPAFRYQLIQKARSAKKRIVLPEGEEPRTVRAAVICEEKGIAHCVLLGKRNIVESIAASQDIALPDGLEILDPDDIRKDYITPMVELRKSKGLTRQQAEAQLEDAVVLGTMMLAIDEVDGLVSGAVHTTANTVRPALQLIKTAPGSSIVSSVFFMLMPDQVLVYGDCAINPAPTAEQLAEIAKQSADSAAAFGIPPRVAMISYSTGSSGEGSDVEKVRRATELAHAAHPELLLDGPLQYDAAFAADVGMQKAPDSPVAGQATVFVFPDLNTGNTTYKAVQRSANVISVGPMLQGLRKPVNDLSRGALVDDIVFTVALTAIQAQEVRRHA